MFIRSTIYTPILMKDIRIPELRKVLKGFPKDSLVKVQNNHVEYIRTENKYTFFTRYIFYTRDIRFSRR